MIFRLLYFSIFIIIANCKKVIYNFAITYGNIAPDCYERGSVLINNQFPPPTIHANQGDILIVNVQNMMDSNVFTLHMHGISQKDTPWNDGVPFITQYPILPMNNYSYIVNIGEQTGTYYYHAHTGLDQITTSGALIIHENIPIYTYNDERIILLSDWWHRSSSDMITDVIATYGLDGKPYNRWIGEPDSILTNGKTLGNWSLDSCLKTNNAGYTRCYNNCNYETINVEPDKIYRFRIIAASTISYMTFSIPNHNLTIIEADGTLTEPYTVDHIEINAGQRYSVLIKTNQIPSDYFIKTQYLWRPTGPTNGFSILKYSNSNNLIVENNNNYIENPEWILKDLNPYKKLSENNHFYKLPNKSNFEITLSTSEINAKNGITEFLINGALYQPPSRPYIYNNNLDKINIVNSLKLKYNEVVDIILQNTVNKNLVCVEHAWHFHSIPFYDLGGGPGLYNKTNKLNKLFQNPILRDTVTLYAYSYADFKTLGIEGTPCGWRIIRLKAINPGFWNVHCHITPHMMAGMQTVMVVDPSKIPPLPNYLKNIYS